MTRHEVIFSDSASAQRFHEERRKGEVVSPPTYVSTTVYGNLRGRHGVEFSDAEGHDKFRSIRRDQDAEKFGEGVGGAIRKLLGRERNSNDTKTR